METHLFNGKEVITYIFCSFLAKRGVKEEIQTFDARKITPEMRKGIEGMLAKNGASFEEAVRINFVKSFYVIES